MPGLAAVTLTLSVIEFSEVIVATVAPGGILFPITDMPTYHLSVLEIPVTTLLFCVRTPVKGSAEVATCSMPRSVPRTMSFTSRTAVPESQRLTVRLPAPRPTVTGPIFS